MNYLLDTNVVSETRRTHCDAGVRAWLDAVADADLCMSVVTIGELACGISRLDAGKKRREIEEWFAQTERYFAGRVLPVDRDIARLWGELTASATGQGHHLQAADGLIAATALRHGLHLMTRNVKDFESTGVRVINPWEL